MNPTVTPDRAPTAATPSAVEAVPPACGAIPYLVVKGASDAIAWYQRVFDARLLHRMDAPDGAPMHAEMQVGPAHFFLTEERAQYGALSPASLGGSGTSVVLYVPDADATFARATAAGSRVTMPIADQFWGDRSACIVDPYGHAWFISTHKEDLSPEQLQERVRQMVGPGCAGAA